MAAPGSKGDGHAESAFRSMSGSFGEGVDRTNGAGGDRIPAVLHSMSKQSIPLLGSDLCNSVPVYGRDVTIIASDASSATDQGSNKVQVSRLVNYEWEVRPYFGHLVAVDPSHTCIAYVLKGKSGGVVRLINRRLAEKALIKCYSSNVVDIAFSSVTKLTLASVEENGSLFVHAITDTPLGAQLLLHLKYTPSGFNALSPHHRVVWCPFIPEEGASEQPDDARHLLAVTFDSRVLMVNVNTVRAKNTTNEWPLEASEIKEGVLEVAYHLKSIVDVAFSPDGTALATASADGFVKFFQVYLSSDAPLKCLHEWLPHEGKMLTSLFFLDDHKHPNPNVQFWKYAVTGADNNRELKVWSCETWSCLQTVRFMPSPNSLVEPHLVIASDLSSRHLVLSDIYRKVLYVLHVHQDEDSSTAHVSGLSEFLLASPCISFGIMDASLTASGSNPRALGQGAEDYEESDDAFSSLGGADRPSGPKGNLCLVAIQPRELNEMSIKYYPELSASLDNSVTGTSVGTLYAPSSPSLDSSAAEPLQHQLSLSNASSVSKTVLLTPNSFLLMSPSASSSLTRVTALADVDQSSATAGILPSASPLLCNSAESPLASSVMTDLLLSASSHASHSGSTRNGNTDQQLARSLSSERPHAFDITLLGAASSEISGKNMPSQEAGAANSHLAASPPSSHRGSTISSGSPRSSSKVGHTSMPELTGASHVPDTSSTSAEPPVAVHGSGQTPSSASHSDDDGTEMLNDRGQSVVLDSSQLDGLDSQIRARQTLEERVLTPSEEDESDSTDAGCSTAAAVGSWPLAPQLLPSREVAVSSDVCSTSPQPVQKLLMPAEHEVSDQDRLLSSLTKEAIANERVTAADPVIHSESDQDTAGAGRANSSNVNLPRGASVVAEERFQGGRLQEAQELHASALDERVWSTQCTLLRLVEAQGRELHVMRQEQLANQQQLQLLQQQLQLLHQNVTTSIPTYAAATQSLLQSFERVEVGVAGKLDSAASAAAQRDIQQLHSVGATIQRSSTDAKAVLERTIPTEVKKAMAPGLQNLSDMVRKELPVIVAERLATSEATVKEHLGSLVTSRQTISSIAEAVGNAVQGSVVAAYRDVMHQTILPSFENSTKKMFQQLNSAFQSGTQEYVKEIQAQFENLRLRQQNAQAVFSSQVDELCKDARTAALEMQESRQRLTAAVQQQSNTDTQLQRFLTSAHSSLLAEIRHLIQEEVRTAFTQLQGSLNAQIAGSVTEAVTRAGAATPLPTGGMDFDQYKTQVANLLAHREINAAFRLALSASDLSKVMYLLKQADISAVFGQTPCPLQQPVILSLVQQLTQDFENEADFDLKYRYLQEGILSLDLSDPVTKEHGPRVLSDLCGHLSSFVQLNSASPVCKPLKMLLMAAQSLIGRK